MPQSVELFFSYLDSAIDALPGGERKIYIQEQLIPAMNRRRLRDEPLSREDVVRKLFSTDSDKPGELIELLDEIRNSKGAVTPQAALEIADIVYYMEQVQYLFGDLPGSEQLSETPEILEQLRNVLGVSLDEARLFCIVKYLTRMEYGDLPKEEYKAIEEQMVAGYLRQKETGAQKVAASINDWALAAYENGREDLGRIFSEDSAVKRAGMLVLERLGLPRLRFIERSVAEFYEDPDRCFSELGSSLYYVNLLLDGGARRVRAIGLDREAALNFIGEEIGEDSSSRVLLYQYYENVFGGNIVVGRDGSLVLELAKGTHGEIVSGKSTPCIVVERDEFLGSLRFYRVEDGVRSEFFVYEDGSVVDAEMVELLFRVLTSIPRHTEEDSYRADWYAGYYEFALVQRAEGSTLSPVFLDYRNADDSKYQFR